MKISCPNCNSVRDIKDASRFLTFQCNSCHWIFKGFEASVPYLTFALKLFNPFRGPSNDLFMKDQTWCPFCGGTLGLTEKSEGAGYYAPSRCNCCGSELDNNPAVSGDKIHFVV